MIRALDVGSSTVGEPAPWAGLDGIAVVGCDPQERLLPDEGRQLPIALGDGDVHELRICHAPGMTSLLEPDRDELARWEGFTPEWAEVVERRPIETVRLDDIAGPFDWVKLDVQGAEHLVLSHGREQLAHTSVVHVECAITPIYVGQRPWRDVDALLASMGFALAHHALSRYRRQGGTQRLFEVDAVYARPTAQANAILGHYGMPKVMMS